MEDELTYLPHCSPSQPLEVLKTHMAANRTDSLREAVSKTVGRGGFSGFYQGLLPWVRFLSYASALLSELDHARIPR